MRLVVIYTLVDRNVSSTNDPKGYANVMKNVTVAELRRPSAG